MALLNSHALGSGPARSWIARGSLVGRSGWARDRSGGPRGADRRCAAGIAGRVTQQAGDLAVAELAALGRPAISSERRVCAFATPADCEGRGLPACALVAHMDVQPITYRGRIVAACTGERFCSPTTSAYRARRSGARGRGGDMRLRYPRGLFDFVLDAAAGACASRPTHSSWPRTASNLSVSP